MVYFWLGVLIVSVIVEVLTAQLVSIWFAAGAFGAFLAAIFGVTELWVQIVIFVALSALTLILTRPLVRKLTKQSIQPTNADMVLGKTGVVTETIDNISAVGAVKVGGAIWTARSVDDLIIEKGERVTVLEISGVKLIVKKEM